MLVGMSHNLTTCQKNNCAVGSAEHDLWVGINVADLENLSMMTKMDFISPTLGRCVMMFRETLFHGRDGTRRGSSSPTILFCSILSCWQIRQVIVNCIASSLGYKLVFFI